MVARLIENLNRALLQSTSAALGGSARSGNFLLPCTGVLKVDDAGVVRSTDLCGPACLDFSIVFHVPAFLFDIFFTFPCAIAILFCVPMLLCRRVYVWGVGWGGTHHTRTVCVLTDQAGQVNSSPHHYPPSLCVCAVGVYWPQAGLGSNSYLIYDPPSTSPLSTRHNCVISPQELEFSIPILSCSALSRSYIKFAFPRTRVPKIPGMRN